MESIASLDTFYYGLVKKNVVPSSKRPGGPMIYSIIYSQQVTQILRYVFSCKEGATIDLLVPSVGVCSIPNLSQK